jgi:hypothetical protein
MFSIDENASYVFILFRFFNLIIEIMIIIFYISSFECKNSP